MTNIRQITGSDSKVKWTPEKIALSFGALLLMYMSHRILYVRKISELLIYGTAGLLFVIYTIYNYKKLEKFDFFKFSSIVLLALLFFYDLLRVNEINIFSIFGTSIKTLGGALLIQCSLEDKKAVYRFFLITTEIIIAIALVGWILVLIGVPLPYYYDNSDVFYTYQNYYIFNLNLTNSGMDLGRFAGPFLEPGHNATMCVFLLFINGFNLKKVGNIVLLLSVLFSLSLAGYGLLIGAVLITLIIKKKYLVTIISAAAFLGIGIGSAYYLKGENPVYEIVFSRLELNENGDDLVGNNRTSHIFDLNYDKFLKSDNIWTGMGSRAFGSKEDGSDNVTIGSAGIKRYIFIRGYVGLGLITLFLLFYWWHFRNARTSGFLVIYIIANLIRDYPTKEMWMYIFLIGIPLMYYNALADRVGSSRPHPLKKIQAGPLC